MTPEQESSDDICEHNWVTKQEWNDWMCRKCGKFKFKRAKNMMNEDKPLSDKIAEKWDKPEPNGYLYLKDVKEKIQNAQRKLKEEFGKFRGRYLTIMNEKDLFIFKEKIDKIFLEEFGDKLI